MIGHSYEHFEIENDGPLIVTSNYWESEIAAAGKLYLTINAGCFRLLVPQIQRATISDMRPGAKHIVVSMLPRDKWVDREYCVEWMVELQVLGSLHRRILSWNQRVVNFAIRTIRTVYTQAAIP